MGRLRCRPRTGSRRVPICLRNARSFRSQYSKRALRNRRTIRTLPTANRVRQISSSPTPMPNPAKPNNTHMKTQNARRLARVRRSPAVPRGEERTWRLRFSPAFHPLMPLSVSIVSRVPA